MTEGKQQRQIDERACNGETGFASFRDGYDLTSSDTSGFEATWWSAPVDGIRIGRLVTAAIAGSADLEQRPGDLTLAITSTGSVQYRTGERSVTAPAGHAHFLGPDRGTPFEIHETTHLFIVTTPRAFISRQIRQAAAELADEAVTSPLLTVLTELCEHLIDPEGRGVDGPSARAVRSMTLATLEDCVLRTVPAAARPALRDQIIDHIDEHVADPDLSPRSIAAHFGISLRWAHRVFDRPDQTLNTYIREHRLQIVAARLRDAQHPPSLTALAKDAGFDSDVHLAGSFRRRFGISPLQYAQQSRATDVPDSPQG